MGTTEQKRTNFELFIDTVNTFKNSQGFYSRLASQIDSWDEDERLNAENYFNSQPQMNDILDMIMFLEC
jgi:hypothetical protein